jgi:ATP-dependent RNA helicase DOB1
MTVKDKLAGPLRQVQKTARRVEQCIQDSKLPLDADEYVDKFKPHMIDIVLEWCRGAKFGDICKMTDIFERPHCIH